MTMVSNFGIAGIAIGSLLASKIMHIKADQSLASTLIILNFISVFANGVKMWINLYAWLAARFVQGVCCGVLNVCI